MPRKVTLAPANAVPSTSQMVPWILAFSCVHGMGSDKAALGGNAVTIRPQTVKRRSRYWSMHPPMGVADPTEGGDSSLAEILWQGKSKSHVNDFHPRYLCGRVPG